MPLSINVGLSRKASRDFQSAGYSINVTAELDQSLLARPDELQRQVADLYAQAESALNQAAGLPPSAGLPSSAGSASSPIPPSRGHRPALPSSSRSSGPYTGNGRDSASSRDLANGNRNGHDPRA